MPQISVIMSVHNGEPYLIDSVNSILNQSYTDFEFIIIDDASTDNTPFILADFKTRDSRIKIITNPNQIGLPRSLNTALDNANGRLIARMDADDISHPLRFEYQYQYLTNHPEIFLAGTSAFHIDSEGHRIGFHKAITNQKLLYKVLQITNHIYHPTIMFYNSPEVRYRDKFVYCQDYDLYLNLLYKKLNLSNLAEPLLEYRITPESVSYHQRIAQQMFYKKALEFYHQRQESNHDHYDDFDHLSIIQAPIEKNTPYSLLLQIGHEFQFLKLKECRFDCRKYYRNYGIAYSTICYHIKSMLGKQIISFIRQLKLYIFSYFNPISTPTSRSKRFLWK